MERLTEFWENKYLANIYNEEKNNGGLLTTSLIDSTKVDKLIQKLGKYEDLEEKGLMIKNPVAIGDIVYRINEFAQNPLIPMGVTAITIKGLTNTFKELTCKECIFGGEITYRFTDIGEKVFITKESALEYLEKIKK